ncbi:MAG: FHA domain-containing protein [Polyangiaceae bacterium]
MPVTVVVHGQRRLGPTDGAVGRGTRRALTFDGPRIVIGRGDGADVRLPDPSVSHRHATLRLRGTEYLLVDEGSANGTRIGRIKLSAHSPRVVRSGELTRVGRVWLEIVIDPTPPTKQAHQAAKELALDLVAESLAADGEPARPVVTVEEGPDAGRSFVLDGGQGTVGRSTEVAISLTDPDVSRRHADLSVRGDVLVVRDLGSKAGTRIGEREVTSTDIVWKAEESLRLGATELRYTYPAAAALAELDRAPDEKLAASELEDEEDEPIVQAPDEAISDAAPEPDPGPEEEEDFREIRRPTVRREKVRWGITDFAVMLVALGILSLSALGYFVLLK